MGGHRWVDTGWVDIGWDIGRVRSNLGCDEGEAAADPGTDVAAHSSASIIPCPLSNPPPMPTDRSDQCTFFVGGSGPEYISIRNFSSCVVAYTHLFKAFDRFCPVTSDQ
jgi:hypothetical protein